MEANHEDKEHLFNGKVEIIKRGSLICGRHALEAELDINNSKIYRLLTILEKEQLIEQRKTNLYTVVSIVCYNKYQSNEQQIEQLVNNERTPSEQRANTPKELIRTNKNITFVPPTIEEVTTYQLEIASPVTPTAFIDFYASKGWVVGKSPMKDWKAAYRRARGWDSFKNKEKFAELV